MAGSNSKDSTEKDLAELNKEFNLLKNTTLDIAVTGNSGVGKSSFVNAIRNIPDFEEGAAKTGETETTMKPEKYPHPLFPELTLWDLPGIGTSAFKPQEYLKKVNFQKYDFIIIASERFTENDNLLAAEIQKMNKKFYFVRTKVDRALEDEGRKPGFDEAQTLNEIREYCRCNLSGIGGAEPQVFLISNRHLDRYDFPLLRKTLAEDLDDLKRPLLIMAMPAFSRENLQEKKAAMEALIWTAAIVSCGVGAIPIPGLSLAFDIGVLVTTMQVFCKTFGLDEDSLRNLAKRVGKPVEVLRSTIKKTPMANQIKPEFVQSLASKTMLCVSAMVLEEITKTIPFLGSIVGGTTSFATTFYMLKRFLEDAVEDAENVLAKVTES